MSQQELPLDPPWWVIRPPGYDGGPYDGFLVSAWSEREARSRFGREVETIVLEDEQELGCKR